MLSNQILSANAKKREMRTQESQRTLMAPCEQLSHPGDSENPDTTTPTGDIRWRNSFSKKLNGHRRPEANDFVHNYFVIYGFYPLVVFLSVGDNLFF
jgi:hypothetical protein